MCPPGRTSRFRAERKRRRPGVRPRASPPVTLGGGSDVLVQTVYAPRGEAQLQFGDIGCFGRVCRGYICCAIDAPPPRWTGSPEVASRVVPGGGARPAGRGGAARCATGGRGTTSRGPADRIPSACGHRGAGRRPARCRRARHRQRTPHRVPCRGPLRDVQHLQAAARRGGAGTGRRRAEVARPRRGLRTARPARLRARDEGAPARRRHDGVGPVRGLGRAQRQHGGEPPARVDRRPRGAHSIRAVAGRHGHAAGPHGAVAERQRAGRPARHHDSRGDPRRREDPAPRRPAVGGLARATRGVAVGQQDRRGAAAAGFPPGWRAGDKTGTGNGGATNDVAIAWPPGRSAVLVAAYLSGSSAPLAAREAALAEVGRLAATDPGGWVRSSD